MGKYRRLAVYMYLHFDILDDKLLWHTNNQCVIYLVEVKKLIVGDIAVFLGTVSLKLIQRSAGGFALLATLCAKKCEEKMRVYTHDP